MLKKLARRALAPAIAWYDVLRLPAPAKEQRRRDRKGLPAEAPDADAAVRKAIAWLGRAQANSSTADGGVARHFSLITGWGPSYPETTGYIVPTMIDHGDDVAREQARRMLDWLVSIQFEDGGFQAGVITAAPAVPTTFNTGQILLGLARGARELGEVYREPMRRAAAWLAATQDDDGCWRKFPTPFADPGEKAYETHVAWGLLEAARIDPSADFATAALRNVRWALGKQIENGWFRDCALNDSSLVLTHTLGYVLRGILEAYRFDGSASLLASARRTADAVVAQVRDDGYLPGRFDDQWRPAEPFVCLTGSVQLAHCLLMLYEDTGEDAYARAGFALNHYVRRTVTLGDDPDVGGAVRGSFPVDGIYGPYEYLSWAAKFFIDATCLEQSIRARAAPSIAV